MKLNSYPFVSAMIVTRNEEEYIGKAVRSLLYQDYPPEAYELLIIDGESTDSTLSVINKEYEHYVNDVNIPVKLTIYKNEKRILATGWNIGIGESKGEYLVRIDGHAYADPDFISQNVKTILNVGAECVGGPIETVSNSKCGELIKKALSSPFGVGGAKFRYKKDSGYVDTVAYGMYKKQVFDELGLFDERLVRTQDNDFHRRMRDKGYKFYLNPAIKTHYYSRNSIKKLTKQQFQNGIWTMVNFKNRPGKMAIRHFIPLIFVLAVGACIVFSLLDKDWIFMLIALLFVYFLFGFYFAFKRSKDWNHRLLMPLIFFIIHFSYGLGSIRGIFKFIK